jgi:hypothetical protein
MPIAHVDNDWIAMAMSDSTGQIKVADGATSQDAAEQTVMSACRKRISDRRLLACGEDECIALVLNAPKPKYFEGWGPTRDAAEAAALATAGGGTVQNGHGHCLGDPVGAGGGELIARRGSARLLESKFSQRLSWGLLEAIRRSEFETCFAHEGLLQRSEFLNFVVSAQRNGPISGVDRCP